MIECLRTQQTSSSLAFTELPLTESGGEGFDNLGEGLRRRGRRPGCVCRTFNGKLLTNTAVPAQVGWLIFPPVINPDRLPGPRNQNHVRSQSQAIASSPSSSSLAVVVNLNGTRPFIQFIKFPVDLDCFGNDLAGYTTGQSHHMAGIYGDQHARLTITSSRPLRCMRAAHTYDTTTATNDNTQSKQAAAAAVRVFKLGSLSIFQNFPFNKASAFGYLDFNARGNYE